MERICHLGGRGVEGQHKVPTAGDPHRPVPRGDISTAAHGLQQVHE